MAEVSFTMVNASFITDEVSFTMAEVSFIMA